MSLSPGGTVLGLFLAMVGCTQLSKPLPIKLVTRVQKHMGTLIEIRVPKSGLLASEEAFQVFADLDQKLSTFKRDSEISLLNRGKSLILSPETKEVLQISEVMKQRSGGFFDIQKGNVGGPRDLGGVGKGFAVDKARKILKRAGVHYGLVAASGDIFCFHACKVAIRDPRLKTQKPLMQGILKSGGWAISTSGRDWRDHIVTPGTHEKPNHWMSVTLISQAMSNAELDAWATALFAMPENRALKVLNSLDHVHYYIVTSEELILKSSHWREQFLEGA